MTVMFPFKNIFNHIKSNVKKYISKNMDSLIQRKWKFFILIRFFSFIVFKKFIEFLHNYFKFKFVLYNSRIKKYEGNVHFCYFFRLVTIKTFYYVLFFLCLCLIQCRIINKLSIQSVWLLGNVCNYFI